MTLKRDKNSQEERDSTLHVRIFLIQHLLSAFFPWYSHYRVNICIYVCISTLELPPKSPPALCFPCLTHWATGRRNFFHPGHWHWKKLLKLKSATWPICSTVFTEHRVLLKGLRLKRPHIIPDYTKIPNTVTVYGKNEHWQHQSQNRITFSRRTLKIPFKSWQLHRIFLVQLKFTAPLCF